MPELVIWGEPPYVPSAPVISPHTGARDMARTLGIPTAGTEGLGQFQPGGEADYMGALRSISDMYESMKPLIDYLGSHPWATIGMLLTAIVAGGAVGGYIGAGLRAEPVKARRKKIAAKRR